MLEIGGVGFLRLIRAFKYYLYTLVNGNGLRFFQRSANRLRSVIASVITAANAAHEAVVVAVVCADSSHMASMCSVK